MNKPNKIVFLHPDLGIGGAERLVVDAALALKNNGYEVSFVTSHHDSNHCFTETKDGTFSVKVVGDWLPRSVFGYFYAVCAYVRMIYAAIYLVYFSDIQPDLVFCDQISICVPILHLSIRNVLFYCHFPDQLLSLPGSMLKKVYRKPINYLEEITTGYADKILVNSKFTREVFKKTFNVINCTPDVLYPSINTKAFDDFSSNKQELENCEDIYDVLKISKSSLIILSVNRFERKKNIKLAIKSFNKLKNNIPNDVWDKVYLVVAGGYDTRVTENVEYFSELKQYTESLNLTKKIHFLKSPTDEEKLKLLTECKVLVYTPSNEHFGIVPLEAMYAKKPVVAVNTGGPTETVKNNETGFLCEANSDYFSEAISNLILDLNLAKKMGEAGRLRFDQFFSCNAFSNQLNDIIGNMLNIKKKSN